MTFVLNAAASSYNCTLSSLWWELLAQYLQAELPDGHQLPGVPAQEELEQCL